MASHTKTPAESARLQKAIADVRPKIQQILQKCKYKAAGLIQPAVDDIKHMCIDADLAYTIPIFGRNCGIHPENRAGTGVDPFNAHRLALKITNQGYSESKLENPMGFEPAGTETAASAQRRNMQMKFNATNFAEANGYLKEIAFYDVTYLPVTCAHTFAALNIIEGECKGLNKEFIGDTGFVDKEKVLKLCPSWKKAMEDGIPCTVFRRELEEACPELPAFLSRAGNQSHDVHSKETKLQLMLALQQMVVAGTRLRRKSAESAPAAASAPAAGISSDTSSSAAAWESVVQEMIAMKPHSADCVKEAAMFTSMWPEGLKEAEIFAKSLKVRREPEEGQLALLATAKMKRAPRWPMMCLKTLMAAPECFCPRHGEARMFTKNDIKNMESHLLPDILKAIGILEKVRDWFHMDMVKEPVMTSRILGDMEVRLVMHVHRFAKKVKTRTQFPSVLAIGQQLVFDVEQAGGNIKLAPWSPANSHATAESAKPAAKVDTVDNGMKLGSFVRLKGQKDLTVHLIQKMETTADNDLSDRAVTLVAGDDSKKTVTRAELADLYMPCKASEQVVVKSQHFVKLEKNEKLVHDYVKGCAEIMLFNAFQLHQPHVNVDLKVTGSREKHIFASVKYQTGALKLVPYTTRILDTAVEGKEKTPNGNFIKIKVQEQGKTYAVTFGPATFNKPSTENHYAHFRKQLLVPYWLVGSTGDRDCANMELSTIKCPMPIAAKDETVDDEVTIPILRNFKVVKENEELLVFNGGSIEPPKKRKRPKANEFLTTARLACGGGMPQKRVKL